MNRVESWQIPVILFFVTSLLVAVAVIIKLLTRYNKQTKTIKTFADTLRQSQNNTANSHSDVTISPEFYPLQQFIGELISDHQSEQANLQELLKEKVQQLKEAEILINSLQQQAELVDKTQQYRLAQQQHWLHNCEYLLQKQTVLPASVADTLLKNQLILADILLNGIASSSTPLLLTDALNSHLSSFNELIDNTGIKLTILEAPENLHYQPYLDEKVFFQLLLSLVYVGMKSTAITELSLFLRTAAENEGHTVTISISGNGQGLSSDIQQQLQHCEYAALSWRDADIGILTALVRQLTGQLDVQSLDGLGCTVQVVFPVKVATITLPKMQRLLVFDADQHESTIRHEGLSALSDETVFCQTPTELIQHYRHSDFDAAVIFLPEQTEYTLWKQLLTELKNQTRLLCYARSPFRDPYDTLQSFCRYRIFCLAQVQHYMKVLLPKVSPANLLVVDDDDTNLAFLSILLKPYPVTLYTASTGNEALLLCLQQRFDVVLLDIQLPDISGVEVVKQLRQQAQWRNIPVLGFTAHALPEEIASFKAAGMNSVILKPLEPARVNEILNWCL